MWLSVRRYEFLVGTPPFYSEDRMTVYKQALSGKVVYPSHVTRFARHLISQFLQVAPSKRIGSLRGGVVDIKAHPFFKDFDWEALETRRMVRDVTVNQTFSALAQPHIFSSEMPFAVRDDRCHGRSAFRSGAFFPATCLCHYNCFCSTKSLMLTFRLVICPLISRRYSKAFEIISANI
jgi:hypothetical protein